MYVDFNQDCYVASKSETEYSYAQVTYGYFSNLVYLKEFDKLKEKKVSSRNTPCLVTSDMISAYTDK